MGHVRLSLAAWLVITLGFGAVGVGGWVQFGAGWGLILCGVLAVLFAVLLLVDFPEPKNLREGRPR